MPLEKCHACEREVVDVGQRGEALADQTSGRKGGEKIEDKMLDTRILLCPVTWDVEKQKTNIYIYRLYKYISFFVTLTFPYTGDVADPTSQKKQLLIIGACLSGKTDPQQSTR